MSEQAPESTDPWTEAVTDADAVRDSAAKWGVDAFSASDSTGADR